MNKTEESIKNTIDHIINTVSEYKSQRYIEYEFRIGHIFPSHFGTDINKKHFETIKKHLDSMSSDICNTTQKEYTLEYDSDSRRRLTMKEDSEENRESEGEESNKNASIVKKTALKNTNFMIENSPFDLRFSVSKEQPVKLFNESGIVKTFIKNRTSYIYKVWTYDLTITTENNNSEKYSIEIEIDPKEFKKKPEELKKILYSTLMKINDLSVIVEGHGSEPGTYKIQDQ